MNKESMQKDEAPKRDAHGEDRVGGEAQGQAEEAPMREVIVWEKSTATNGGGRSQGETTVRAVPIGTGAATGKPPVIVIVSSGFGAGTRQTAPVRMKGARLESGLRMAA